MNVETVIGDTAYSEKDNLAYSAQNGIELVAKLHPMITQGSRKKEDEFAFNKDAGRYVCKAGHLAIRRARQGKKDQGKNQKDTVDDYIELGKQVLRDERKFNQGAGFGDDADDLPEFFRTKKLSPHDVVFDVPQRELKTVFNF